MARVIIPEISKKNPYYISKHRYYELKHFCLQYPEWKRRLKELRSTPATTSLIFPRNQTDYKDDTFEKFHEIFSLEGKCEKVDHAIQQLDPWIQNYIFIAVTEDRPFTYLKTVMDIPCERDAYYERYRKFYYSLNLQLL